MNNRVVGSVFSVAKCHPRLTYRHFFAIVDNIYISFSVNQL